MKVETHNILRDVAVVISALMFGGGLVLAIVMAALNMVTFLMFGVTNTWSPVFISLIVSIAGSVCLLKLGVNPSKGN